MRDAAAAARDRRLGLGLGVAAYAAWGVVPLFWRELRSIPALEILAHRAVWGLGAFALLTLATGQGAGLRTVARQPRALATLAGSGALLAANWGLFIWATLNGHLLQASLGYFINPLVSVALGVGVLRERLAPLTVIAITVAAIGVGWLTIVGGRVPWIALALATSFGIYGLVRKVIAVPALVGSTIETAMIAPIGAAYLIYLAARGGGGLGHVDGATHALLIATGFVTAVPLAWFTAAARRLPLSTVGLLQYLAPTGQLIMAVAVFHEPLSRTKLTAFGFIWVALAVFTIELVRPRRRPPRPA
ncbi:MAG: EamA family transporter RarD [Myxococcales bacterium]|nr:EamA family transporter RarD [Myxococcales bacterium]